MRMRLSVLPCLACLAAPSVVAASAAFGEDLRRPVLGIALAPHGGGWRVVDGDDRVLGVGDQAWCDRRRAEVLVARHGRGHRNLRLPTLGGMQCWADLFSERGWRIQRNIVTGHCRLLDDRDRRHAWGDVAACRATYEWTRVARGLAPPRDDLVILLHGLGRSRRSLARVAAALGRADRDVVAMSYPSTRAGVAEHAQRLAALIAGMRGVRRVSFVTHSLGALVVREALAHVPGDRVAADRLCMIFPPNRGSDRALAWSGTLLFQLLCGPAGADATPMGARAIPPPSCRFAIIAGGRGDGVGRNRRIPGDDDGTVAVAETMLDGADEHVVLDVGHTVGMGDPRVVAAVVRYLDGGALRPSVAPP
ncbi:MAG TPA: hypothetical protein VEL07_20980 [Planctomycetota bacterium]|nr:hypothetical protein [Planctomycetota bacterium]